MVTSKFTCDGCGQAIEPPSDGSKRPIVIVDPGVVRNTGIDEPWSPVAFTAMRKAWPPRTMHLCDKECLMLLVQKEAADNG